VDDETAEAMLSLAGGFRLGVGEETGIQLGWDLADVEQLDEICEAFLRGRPSADFRHSMIMAMGAYLGEVIVRHSGGRWWYDARERAASFETPDGLQGRPHDKVAKKLEDCAAHNLLAYYTYAVRREVLPGTLVKEHPATQ
jgi:hypothetical protein